MFKKMGLFLRFSVNSSPTPYNTPRVVAGQGAASVGSSPAVTSAARATNAMTSQQQQHKTSSQEVHARIEHYASR